jgi:ubiquinone/menaquinone biosynthesis C-methylase UbiE
VVDLGHRAVEPELLDEGVSEAETLRSLADLRFVNRWLGGRRAVRRAVAPILRGVPGARLLDVGCGSADLPAFLVRSLPGAATAVGVDLKLLHLQQAPAEVRRVVADVRSLPFASRSFDVVLASLFLHHFDGHEVAEVLGRLYALCRRALVVNDLHRARVPYLFARAVFPWVLKSPVSVADGLLSIRRAFTPSELAQYFREAGIDHVEVRRSLPYRLVAVATRS